MKYCTCLFIVLLCVSCTKSDKVKVGFLCWNNSNTYALQNLNCFKEKALLLGVDVIDKDAHCNEVEQYNQAVELIDQGVKVLVVYAVNAVTAAAIVRKAHKKGVKIIAYDRMIKNCDLDYYVTFDSRKVGEYMAREAIAQKTKGNYLLLMGDKSDDNAILVESGIMKVVQPQINNGNIKLIYNNYIEDWSLENADHEVDMVVRLTSGLKIDAVIASCDDMARGSINVLKRNDMPSNTFISGQNSDIESLKMILNGEQTVTIFKSPKTFGYAVAELAVKLATQSNTKLKFEVNDAIYNGYYKVPSILFDPVLITKSNLEKEIFSDEIISKKELFNR
jgi:D-xylose transport system substrate-binding protein